MKTFVAVAWRELAEKRFVFWAALGCALLPFAVPLIHAPSVSSRREIQDLVALITSLGIASAVGLGAGSSIFAGDLAAKRMGFYFSRPISATALWAGKLVAAIFLTLAAFAIVIVPAILVDGADTFARELPLDARWIPLLLGLLVLAASVFATAVRSRSRFVLIDLVAAVVVALMWVWVLTRLVRELVFASNWMAWLFAAVGAAAFAVASWRSISRGRTDLVAAHAAQTRTIWPLLAAPAVLLGGYLAWATHAPATALSKIQGALAHGGSWISVWGTARGLESVYLYEPSSSRWQRLPRRTETAISADGRTAAWLQPESKNGPWTLWIRNLADASARPAETKIAFRSPVWPLHLSPDGSRIATVGSLIVEVHEIASGRLVFSGALRRPVDWALAVFEDPNRLRVLGVGYESGGRRALIAEEANLSARTLGVTGFTEDVVGSAVADPALGRVIFRSRTGGPLEVHDGRTLQGLATLEGTQGGPWSGSGTFRAERILVGGADSKTCWVSVFSKDGSPQGRIPLGPAGRLRIGGAPRESEVFVSIDETDSLPPGRRPTYPLYLVELGDKTARKVADGLRPVGWWFQGPPQAVGAETAKIFVSNDEQLVRFDPATGDRKVLLGGR